MKLLSTFLAAGIACGGLHGCFAAPTEEAPESKPAQNETVRASRQLSELQDTRIDESSGLAASRKFVGLFWTHNDSGDKPRAWLVDPKNGATKTLVDVSEATSLDWEDCAVGAGKDGESWLYLGDIGDNAHRRANIVVYRVAESKVNVTHGEQTVVSEKQTLVYPDGAHDAETLIATRDERLIVVSKSADGSSIYISPKFEAGTTQTLKKIGAVKFESISYFARLATGGDLSADGKRFVIRTYTHAYEWTLPPDTNIEGNWWQTTPRKFLLPPRPQGEAIAYATDSETLVVSTEKLPTALDEIAPEGKSNGVTPDTK